MADSAHAGRRGCVAAAIVALLFCVVMVLRICYTKVPANAIGVRTLASGGIENVDYRPGFVLCVPWLHSVRLWDPTWTEVVQRREVQGSDQSRTMVDVSVIFHIKPGECHKVAGNFADYHAIEERVGKSLSQYANQHLTEMKTEDFYNSARRIEKTAEVQKDMDTQLEPLGLEVKSVLLRNIDYDANYEVQLMKKQLSEQTLLLEESKTKQAEVETKTELIEKQAVAEVNAIREGLQQEVANNTAQTDQKINEIMQNAQVEATKTTALADAEKRKLIAQADYLKAEATASGIAALSLVYSRPGASYFFAQKALQGMRLGNVEVNSSTFNPLDAEKLLKALGLDLHAPRSVPAAP